MFTIPLIALALSLAGRVAAQGRTGTSRGPTFFGCYPARPTNGTTSTGGTTVVTATANATSYAACMNNCMVQDTTTGFGYWLQSTTECYCGNGVQAATQLQTSNIPCAATSWTYGRTSTTFQQYGNVPCRSFANIGLAASSYSAIAGPRSCQRSCVASRYAYLYFDTTNGLRCACSNTARGDASSTFVCTQNSVFAWEHSPIAQASSLDRRKKREAKALEAQKPVILCPKGLAACSIQGVADAFECLDPQNDLESCGGCVHGLYGNTNLNQTLGQDCSGVDRNARIGGATCTKGQCIISACKKGFEPVDNRCRRAS